MDDCMGELKGDTWSLGYGSVAIKQPPNPGNRV